MATIVLSTAGAAAGASVGGSFLGVSSAVIGRAAGAVVGQMIDQRLLGPGSQAVDTGRTDRVRISGASEGVAVSQVWGRMRVPGQIIWSSRFKEQATTQSSGGGGKGVSTPSTSTTSYSYSVSIAVALCEGVISGIGRVWADGTEVSAKKLSMRVYHGTEDQLPDPKIAAVEGEDNAPAYRGMAYVVIEDLQLAAFGNRVPQFSFEVMRPGQGVHDTEADPLNLAVKGVALLPGSGEYTLATQTVYLDVAPGRQESKNRNSASGKTDFVTAMDQLDEELPECGSTLLVASWFGDDLRCDRTQLRPKVEQTIVDSVQMPWNVAGVDRYGAEPVVQFNDGKLVYGGTPADDSVVQAIQDLQSRGKAVVFYPFILMEQLSGNGLSDPWSGASDQPVLPWRGRITTSVGPGQGGTPQGSAAARSEVAAFFGTVSPGDFQIGNGAVTYTGPDEWSYRRFILHYAALCAAAGDVDAFCIGSEMRGLTQILADGHSFPAVDELIALAADVRSLLGPATKIGYAADWSEYFGFNPGGGDRYFHLDALWADANIDFIGIDNYMPVADWRDDPDHADSHWGSGHDIGYLQSNIEGGEGYDWYYADDTGRDAQTRLAISDGAHGEPWVWRYKDIRSFWSLPHHERIGGVRQATPTAWVPQSKPIWFTEFGCAAIDKGANQPNKFVDPKSSESDLPHYSTGARDDLIQMQYVRAVQSYWENPGNNPTSSVYGGPMIDMTRAHVWAWDARPYPAFPGRADVWGDSENYIRGHWLNGRTASSHLVEVVREICARAGVTQVDTDALQGYVRGYAVGDLSTARAALQPLMLAHGFDVTERDGVLRFRNRTGMADVAVTLDDLAVHPEQDADLVKTRQPQAETPGRVQIAHVAADGQYDVRVTEATHPVSDTGDVTQTDLNMSSTFGEAARLAERWLSEAEVARDTITFALPPSYANLAPGDIIEIEEAEGPALYRIERIEDFDILLIEAVRIDPGVYVPGGGFEEGDPLAVPPPSTLVFPLFLDLPLLNGDENEYAPHLAVASNPWPGEVAVYSSSIDANYGLNDLIDSSATLGFTLNPLARAEPGLLDRGAPLQVDLSTGELSSAQWELLLNGANAVAIGDGQGGDWEVFQFQEATLVSGDTYALSLRLRGQQGTDAIMPDDWPAGSVVVLLNAAVGQVDVASASKGLNRHYRVGPSDLSLDSEEYVHLEHAATAVALRPYAPVHGGYEVLGDDTHRISWVRRTRIGGDDWDLDEVPLGEASERYRVTVRFAGNKVRTQEVSTPQFDYTPALRAADGVTGDYFVRITQLSDLFGPGPGTRIDING